MKGLPPGVTSVVYGLVEDIRAILTKKGDKMAFVKISDMTGTLEVVFFPKAFEEAKALLVPGTCIGIKGKISSRNGELSMLADRAKAL